MGRIGASVSGDLQIAWLTSSSSTGAGNNENEIPVYLDAKNHDHGECAMYVLDATTKRRHYITKPFKTNPILYVAGSEGMVKKFLIESPDIASRFRLIEPPKSKLGDMYHVTTAGGGGQHDGPHNHNIQEEEIEEIHPFGGTLVLFDSVTLPHEVLATKNNKERWACSGWFHEDQQEIAVL